MGNIAEYLTGRLSIGNQQTVRQACDWGKFFEELSGLVWGRNEHGAISGMLEVIVLPSTCSNHGSGQFTASYNSTPRLKHPHDT